MAQERSVYLVKPEGVLLHLAEIHRKLRGAKLVTIGVVKGSLTTEAIALLYPHLASKRGPLWNGVLAHLSTPRCELGIVEGDNAIEKLRHICGTDPNPNKCAHNSIRGAFARKTSIPLGEVEYWHNVMSCARNKEEVEYGLAAFRKLNPDTR